MRASTHYIATFVSGVTFRKTLKTNILLPNKNKRRDMGKEATKLKKELTESRLPTVPGLQRLAFHRASECRKVLF